MTSRGEPGIYGVRCTATGHVYIGSALSMDSRLRHHRHRLEDGRAHNKVLQFAWDVFGSEAFSFEELERCDRSQLKDREDWHLKNSPDPLFNLVKTAHRIKHSVKGRAKLSEKAKLQHASGHLGQGAWRTSREEIYRKAGESNSRTKAGKVPNFKWTAERKARVAEAMRQRRAREKEANAAGKVQT